MSLLNEDYGLNWIGKSLAKNLSRTVTNTILKEDIKHNSKEDNVNSKNLLFKGDNLDVLKHLTKNYTNKIKMIYIDPPYNTGKSNFIYNDKKQFSLSDFGVNGQESENFIKTLNKKQNKHSAWLTFMYPRLYVARRLLKEDGVIFISIDDNEVAQLRLLMDEIFGEENFVAELIWNKQHSQQQGLIKKYHESVFVYSKYSQKIEKINGGEGEIIAGAQKKISTVNPSSEFLFPKGTRVESDRNFTLEGTYGNSEKTTVVNGKFICSNGKLNEDVVLEAGWTQKNQMISWFKGLDTKDTKGQKVLEFYFNSKGKLKYRKDRSVLTPPTILPSFGMPSKNTNELSSLMGGVFFQNPKPIDMIKLFGSWFCDKDSIILDFFAGSGTTGDAVMRLNAEDGGNRKYILVQIPEVIDPKKNKIAYDFVTEELKAEPTIFEITKERLKRAAEKIKQEKPDYKGDLGFKIFEIN